MLISTFTWVRNGSKTNWLLPGIIFARNKLSQKGVAAYYKLVRKKYTQSKPLGYLESQATRRKTAQLHFTNPFI